MVFEKYKNIQNIDLEKTKSRQLSNLKMERFHDKIQRVNIRTESDSVLTVEEKKSFCEYDKFYTGEKVNRLFRTELDHNKFLSSN